MVGRHDEGRAPDQDEWAQVVSSAEDHVRREMSGAPGPRRPLPGRAAFLVAVGVVMTVSIAMMAPRLVEGPPAALTLVEQSSDLRQEAAILIEQIEAYRDERGVLPAAAMLAPFLEGGYEYRVMDRATGRFEVRRSAGGVEVVYDGSLPLGLWVLIGGSTEGGTGGAGEVAGGSRWSRCSSYRP